MSVTIAPSTEAMTVIVDRVNTSTVYDLAFKATYCEEITEPLEEITDLRVDVVTETEETLNETLDVEDRTSLAIRIWIRKKVATPRQQDEIDGLKLLVRQIFQMVNNFNSSDGRVKVWECDLDPKECPIKDVLRQNGLFITTLLLRVEVEANG